MTPQQEIAFLRLIENCARPSQAARAIGFTPQWISVRKKKDPAFAEAIAAAEARAECNLVEMVRKAAPKDWRAAARILESRFPDGWARRDPRSEMMEQRNSAGSASTATIEKWKVIRSRIPGMELLPEPAPLPAPAPAAEPEESTE